MRNQSCSVFCRHTRIYHIRKMPGADLIKVRQREGRDWHFKLRVGRAAACRVVALY